MIKEDSSQINNVAQQCINQTIAEGGKELERVLPKILRRAIKDVYETPFISSLMLRPHYDVSTGTSIRRTYFRRFCIATSHWYVNKPTSLRRCNDVPTRTSVRLTNLTLRRDVPTRT